MSNNSQPAPFLVPIDQRGGLITNEWLRWFQQLYLTGSTVTANSAALSTLQQQLATDTAAIAALQKAVAALQAGESGEGTGTSSGTSILLQTNGATNALQSKLNLQAGSNIALVSDTSGDVTISTTGGGQDPVRVKGVSVSDDGIVTVNQHWFAVNGTSL